MTMARSAILLAMCICPAMVGAIPISQNFSGVQLQLMGEFINAVPVPVNLWQFAPSFTSGQTVTGAIAYDTDQPDTDPSADTGTYRIGTLAVNIPQLGLVAVRSSNNMQISAFNNPQPTQDQFFAFASGVDNFSSTVGLPNPESFSVLLFGDSSMLANDQLPITPLNWNVGNVSFDFVASDLTVRQVLIRFLPPAVPEPATFGLTVLGLVGIGFVWRKTLRSFA